MHISQFVLKSRKFFPVFKHVSHYHTAPAPVSEFPNIFGGVAGWEKLDVPLKEIFSSQSCSFNT